MSRSLTYIFVAACTGVLFLSCHKESPSNDSELRLRETVTELKEDYRAIDGLVYPIVEEAAREGEWGYGATVRFDKCGITLATAYSTGELIHTPDGIIYGLSADEMTILLGERLVVRGDNQNLVEYAYTLAAIGAMQDKQQMEYALALPNSMGKMEVFYPDEPEVAVGEVFLIANEHGYVYNPAFAVRLYDSGAIVVLDIPLLTNIVTASTIIKELLL